MCFLISKASNISNKITTRKSSANAKRHTLSGTKVNSQTSRLNIQLEDYNKANFDLLPNGRKQVEPTIAITKPDLDIYSVSEITNDVMKLNSNPSWDNLRKDTYRNSLRPDFISQVQTVSQPHSVFRVSKSQGMKKRVRLGDPHPCK